MSESNPKPTNEQPPETTPDSEAKPEAEPIKPAQDSLTVVETAYLQSQIGDIECVESRFCRLLDNIEQLYKRRLVVGEEWKPLDTGWIENVGMLIISNEEGKNLSVNPTDEEKAETASKIVEISSDINLDFAWQILPGESMRATPSNVSNLFIRCLFGSAMVVINAFPK